MPRNLTLVKPSKCRRTAYPDIERARQVIWLMTTRGINTTRLRPIACNECHKVHIVYAKPLTSSVSAPR